MDILQKNVDITELSNYKTPAITEYFFEINSEEDIDNIFNIYKWASKKDIPVLIVSGGTNMLFAFDIYPGVIIKNNLSGWTYNTETKILETYSQELIWTIAFELEDRYNQDLWHRFIGLPGTVGGAIYGNAGCFGLETENNFLDCRLINLKTGEKLILQKEEMNFEYRDSLLKQEKIYFIIDARFDLSQKIEKYHSDVDNIDFRDNKQPKGNSCGSFFKNPNKEISAGALIEKVGLKGYAIGGAYYSQQHANFLMHDGHGTYKDLIQLIELAQKRVFESTGIQLVNEVQIITI
ncbi:UDP-N-acetylmuramate dehydrogenase [Candidatus Gracilibacteria bacterium]|nr:UDP-N-acetylmuramate dehydrogenase [Candidatus Gracilibacteria bacterium]